MERKETMIDVQIEELTKKYGNVVAVDEINLTIPYGKLTVLVGPSGCGKTTLLKILAGLEEPTAGCVIVNGQDVAHIPAWDRNVAMVFQSYALYPHMSVYKNMAFPLQARKIKKDEIDQRIRSTAVALGIDMLLDRAPRELSGGQMQRVAIGRAIVRTPEVFLMDEPLSNLDAKLRVDMRAELKRLQRKLGVTTIYVTHDQAEAMTLADHLVVMNHGKIQQCGHPEKVYHEPENVFVAGFLGNPAMNFVPCSLSSDGSKMIGDCFEYELPEIFRTTLAGAGHADELIFGIRPECIQVILEPVDTGIQAEIYVTEALGRETLVTLKCGEQLIKAIMPPNTFLDIGTPVWITFDAENVRIFDGDSDQVLVNGSYFEEKEQLPS
jgi:multiple sugar transport system ATP-binding protein